MSKNNHDIIDQFDEVPESQWYEHWSVVYTPLALIICGVLFNLQQWPFGRLLMVIGLFLAMIRSFIYFFAKPRPIAEWIYFLARIALFAGLLVHFGMMNIGRNSFIILLSIYAFAVIIHLLKSKVKSPDEEQITDDY